MDASTTYTPNDVKGLLHFYLYMAWTARRICSPFMASQFLVDLSRILCILSCILLLVTEVILQQINLLPFLLKIFFVCLWFQHLALLTEPRLSGSCLKLPSSYPGCAESSWCSAAGAHGFCALKPQFILLESLHWPLQLGLVGLS